MSQHNNIKLLLVEDHLALREVFYESLTAQGYQVAAFESAEDALAAADIDLCKVALLDLNLPGEDGLFLATELRMRTPSIGIIMLTTRNQIADKLAGYEAGADIYLPKPVSPEELKAAIQAVCRRIPNLNEATLTLHFSTGQLVNTHLESVLLSQEDSRLLTLLAQAPQQQLEYWELAEYLKLDMDNVQMRTALEKRISRLRKKLAQLNQPSSSIKAIRGFGYKFNLFVNII